MTLSPAVQAFDGVAATFDQRFGEWQTVAAQRRAVRRYLDGVFHSGNRVLELGGGTGEDAIALAERGVRVLLTDGSPEMIARAADKVRRAGHTARISTAQVTLEHLHRFAADWLAAGHGGFDGVYSNFAVLNCLDDLTPIAEPLGRLLNRGSAAVLVLFGPHNPVEIAVQLAQGDLRAAFRRLRRGPAPAHIGGRHFVVRYPRPRAVARALRPFFRLVGIRGIGVFVPPSALEPAMSRWPRVVRALEWLDRAATRPLSLLGDHVLLHLERTAVSAG